MRLWIDTDIGDNPDDTVALWCAARLQSVDLMGVSTVDGDVEARARIARSIVPDVEVVAGAPIAQNVAETEALLGIGPWTNCAALAAEHALPPRVVMMGGVLGPIVYRGKVQTVEHNVGTDPVAANKLLSTTGGLIVVPLDATVHVEMNDNDEQVLIDAIPGLREQLARWREKNGPVPLVAHDPAALLVLAGERIARLETRRLTVEEDGTMRSSIDTPLQRVVSHIDADAARARIRALAEGD
jgi:inosine-uridine nucleoside N-ribohydrolase